ncbi:MAG: Beta-lactamase precursor [Pseudomonadota bacterium]|jgi:glyoxylase-like metal-dependent hydrolase (beta-lactamase superfamily II)
MNHARRKLVKFSLGSLAATALPAWSVSIRAQQPTVSIIDAGGSNVVVCDTADGLVLVDSGTPTYASTLVDQLRAVGNGRVHTLFNTHWHHDNCGANELIGDSGAAIVAHQKTWQRLATQYYVPHEQRYVEPLPETARPTVKFAGKGSLQVGAETIDYGALVLPHTDGDIYVHFRNANVLVVGGAVTPPELDPELDWYGGGWLGGRAQSLDTLLALADDATLIVPAAGRTLTKAELSTERDMTHELYQRLNKLIRSGCSATCMADEGALEGLGRRWQDPQRFLYAAYKGLWAHHYNLAPDIL